MSIESGLRPTLFRSIKLLGLIYIHSIIHHRLDGHEFEHVPGVVDRQGRLACCSPWGRKELDMTE